MSNEMWLQRWKDNQIGWHEQDVNPFLEKNFQLLRLKQDDTVFIPLCGKTLDIAWLLSHGLNVVGCELSEVAISELFEELEIEPKISIQDHFKVYTAEGIKIYQGDIFHLSKECVGGIDAIYDRAALVALPLELRRDYTALLREITNNAKQLLITVVYEQEKHNRTPYSIPQSEIEQHYQEFYKVQKIDSIELEGGLKGLCSAQDEVWFLE